MPKLVINEREFETKAQAKLKPVRISVEVYDQLAQMLGLERNDDGSYKRGSGNVISEFFETVVKQLANNKTVSLKLIQEKRK